MQTGDTRLREVSLEKLRKYIKKRVEKCNEKPLMGAAGECKVTLTPSVPLLLAFTITTVIVNRRIGDWKGTKITA